jgi:hypothetical protein
MKRIPWSGQHLSEGAEEAVGRGGEPAHALDGLGDQGGHVAGGAHVDDVAQVLRAGVDVVGVVQLAEGAAQPVAALHEGDLEAREAGGRPAAVGGHRHRPEGAPVVAVAQGQDLVAAPVAGGGEEGGLVGLGARGGEEHLGVGDARQAGQALGQLDEAAAEVQRRGVEELAGLGPQRLGDLGDVVAGDGGQDAAEEVEVAGAVGRPDVAALPVGELDGLVVVQPHPPRGDGAVPFEQAHRATSRS